MAGADRTALERFYRDVLWELGEWLNAPQSRYRRPSAEGAATVVKRVALAHGISGASTLPLPRLSRAAWKAQAVLPDEASEVVVQPSTGEIVTSVSVATRKSAVVAMKSPH